MTASLPRRCLASAQLLTGLIAVLSLASCSDNEDTSVTRHAPPMEAPASDVITGSGGQASGLRSWSDPLRFCYMGLPLLPPTQAQPVILYNDGYVVGYDMARHLPLWACYRLYAAGKPAGEESRSEAPATPSADARLVPQPPAPQSDDRHRDRDVPPWFTLVPAEPLAACYGAHAGSEAILNSDALTLTPPPGWFELSRLETAYAQNHHEVWVLTGPLLHAAGPGENAIAGMWKIQVVVADGKTQVQAFILPAGAPDSERHREHPIDLSTLLTSIDAISARTGLSFMPDLHPTDRQSHDAVTSFVPGDLWDGASAAPAKTASASSIGAASAN